MFDMDSSDRPSLPAFPKGMHPKVTAWDIGQCDAHALIEAFRRDLDQIIGWLGVSDASDALLAELECQLQRRRETGAVPLSTPHNLLWWSLATMRDYLVATIPDYVAPHPPEVIRDVARQTFRPSARRTLSWRERIKPNLAQVQIASTPYDIPIIDIEPPEIAVTVDELARLAGADSLEQQMFLRLLALRTIGGWSLREIAKRDNVTLDRVADQWFQARQWLQKRLEPSVGTIATLDLVDVRLLEVLLSDPKLTYMLDWRSFEKALAAIVERLGYEVELQRGTKDGGIDIIAIRRDKAFGGHRYLLQAKRWSHHVGVETVREVLFLREHYRATKACLATTSTFTRGAWELGQEYRWQLELRDSERLIEWLQLLHY